MMSPKGGKREGAGRKKPPQKVRCNVTLSPDILEILKPLCGGNRSAAIEFVVREWVRQNKNLS